jgi:hypothetical protein
MFLSDSIASVFILREKLGCYISPILGTAQSRCGRLGVCRIHRRPSPLVRLYWATIYETIMKFYLL